MTKLIGRIIDIGRDHVNDKALAWVAPLLHANEETGRWEGPIEDTVSTYPSRGRIFWYDARDVQYGDYVVVTVNSHPKYGAEHYTEKYQVANAKLAEELFDLRAAGEGAVRRALAEGTLRLPAAPLNRDGVFIWLEDDLFVGPVNLEEAPRGWRAVYGDPTRIDAWQLSGERLNRTSIDGSPRIFLPPSPNAAECDRGNWAGFRNWASDHDLVIGMLKQIRKFDREALSALGATYAGFEKYLELLQQSTLTDDRAAQEAARRDRIMTLQTTIDGNRHLIERATEALMSTPAVAAEVERAIENARELATKRAEVEAREQIIERSAALTEKSEQLEKITRDLATLEDRSRELDTAIKHKERELEERVATFDRELAARLEKLLEKPERLFSELAVMRMLGGGCRPLGAKPAAARVDLWPHPPAEPTVAEVQVLKGRLQAVACHRGIFSSTLLTELTAAFVSGAVPVVAGSNAFEVVSVFAEVAASGRVLWIPVSGTVLGPSDLFGTFDVASGRFVHHPSCLLKAVAEARDSGELSIVLLDGFNRAPVDSYLLPLLQSRSDVVDDRSVGRRIPVAPPGTFGANGEWAGLESVEWPANLLLALIPSEGTLSLPIPRALWTHCVLVDTDYHRDEDLANRPIPNAAPPPSRVPDEVMRTWWSEARTRRSDGVDSFVGRYADELPALRLVHRIASKVGAAGQLMEYSQSDFLARRLSIWPACAHDSRELPPDLNSSDLAQAEAIRQRLAPFVR
jgi:hypothetical protein